MKILHVISEMDPKLGGVSQAVQTIATGLNDLGTHNEVLSLDLPDEPFLKQFTFLNHCVGPKKGPWSYSDKLLPWLLNNIKQYDVIIVHGLWLYHSYAVNKAVSIVKKKDKSNISVPRVFVMPHGMLDPYFQKAAGRKIKAIRNWLYWKIIEQSLINDADGLLFTCEEEMQLAREPFKPYAPKKEIVVGLGVNEPPSYDDAMREAFYDKVQGLKERPYLLFISRIHQKKGVGLLINAFLKIVSELALTNPEFINIPALVIAGPGLDTPYGQSIKKIVSQSTMLQKLVIFPGMLTGNAKWGAFYNCEAFILPSHQENFGIAVVESLACAKPVLISNKVNIWREIEFGKGGLVGEDTPEGINELITKWLRLDESDKTKLGVNAVKCYQKNFAVTQATKKLLKALQ